MILTHGVTSQPSPCVPSTSGNMPDAIATESASLPTDNHHHHQHQHVRLLCASGYDAIVVNVHVRQPVRVGHCAAAAHLLECSRGFRGRSTPATPPKTLLSIADRTFPRERLICWV